METKNIVIIISCLLFCTLSAEGQTYGGFAPLSTEKYDVLDRADYQFTYDFTFVTDTVHRSTDKNTLILSIGKGYSKMFGDYLLPKEETARKQRDKKYPNSREGVSGKGLNGTEVYKDLTGNRMTVTTIVMIAKTRAYVYEEEIPVIHWNMMDESKMIDDYSCTKATCHFLGRDYVAWFAPDLPISNGPWKLGGLPGMILEANDVQNYFVFKCTGIEKLKTVTPIVKYQWPYLKTSRKDLNKLIKNSYAHPYRMEKEDGVKTIIIMDQNNQAIPESERESLSLPYNPLEKE